LVADSHLISAVKLATRDYMKFCPITVAFGLALLTSVGYAQTSPPSTSAMVSPKSDAGEANSTIEPVKPSIMDESTDDSITVDPSSLLPDLPPVPHANATLVGGTIERLDRVRDRVVVRVFGGGRMVVLFDPRTTIVRGKKDASIADLREGERIYLDTMLDGDKIFARMIRLNAPHATGQSQGVILKYSAAENELTLRDSISPKPVEVRLTAATKVSQGGRTMPISALVPGSLVSISFGSDGAGHNTAGEISILAQPGTHYTFTGEVVHIDLRTGLVVLRSSTDNKTYEVYLNTSITADENLHPGALITVVADFDGSRYLARNLSINSQ
jgi:hypothetical protein